ncbi:helix-turn-helix transcriptional regulator [Devosia sp.]|uniref:AraC family transcriptional regulator n=1 Tax=Devosia sp. TaxID=1871048 RepID=UPI001ACFA931|nr:helix-turn-helix transcriptional regulator [Devosia sp.]MBN9333167.1 helix-turn-helix transcriptional regulator [Devosia sp.]
MDSLHACLASFDPDLSTEPVLAISVEVREHEAELPMHQHGMGQLVVALQGGVMCRVQGGLWMVPSGSGVWIPGGVAHSNHVSANGRICLLFVAPSIPGLPENCCTLSLTPMLIEMIKHIATASPNGSANTHRDMITQVILEELRRMDIAALHLPIPDDPTMTKIANALINNPGDRSTVAQWADRVAMSERSLTRLVSRHTSMSFGRWRQQLHIIVALQKLSAGATVQNVSDDLGYESVSAFITMFKNALGKPPGRYMAERMAG